MPRRADSVRWSRAWQPSRADSLDESIRPWQEGHHADPSRASLLVYDSRISSGFTFGLRRRHEGDQRVPELLPAVEATLKGPHAHDAATSEEQRHPGARGLVGSRAVQHDLVLARDLPVPRFQLVDAEV